MQDIQSQKFALRPKVAVNQMDLPTSEQLPAKIDATPLYDVNSIHTTIDPTDYLIYDSDDHTMLIPAPIFENAYWVPGVNCGY